jgi:uncharacterized membrane protein
MPSTRNRRPVRSGVTAAVLLGVATGMRSTAGFGVLILRDGRPGDRALPGPLGARLAKPAAVLAIGSELVLDKLPIAGSRLEPAGLVGRVSFAAIGGALVARGSGFGPLPAALVAAAAAVASAKVFHDLRALADRRVPDVAVALAEDALALRIAALATS